MGLTLGSFEQHTTKKKKKKFYYINVSLVNWRVSMYFMITENSFKFLMLINSVVERTSSTLESFF